MPSDQTTPRPGDEPCAKGCVMFQPYMREMNLAVKWENEALRLRAALVALRDRHREFGVFDLVMLEKVLADG